ncbi:hypothetical protein BH09ACT10_BH09ACT10_07850 [soil metagenome]
MNAPTADRVAKWLAGDQLAAVLHLGEGALAHDLADQGHDVVVATQHPAGRHHPQIEYVEVAAGSFPFVSEAFTVVIANQSQSQTALAEIARVLTSDGLISSISKGFDETIPWLRKMREIVGERATNIAEADTLTASGLFAEPETFESADWEKLDLDGLMMFARESMRASDVEGALARVHELFESYGATHQPLRLRRSTRCMRSRVLKENLPEAPEPPDTMLFDLR